MPAERVVVSDADRIRTLRQVATDRGAELKAGSVVDGRLLKLLGLMGDDLDLAADALAMWPRPDWLLTHMGL